MARDVTLFEVFDVFVQCRAAPCEVLRKIKNAFENVCVVAPASKECDAQGGPSTGCPPWKIEIFLEKRVPRTDTERAPPLGGGSGQDEGEAIFGNGHRYKWVRAEGALVGWTEGLVDIYNTSSHLQRRLGVADAPDGSDIEGAEGAGGAEAGGGLRGDGMGNKEGGSKGGGGDTVGVMLRDISIAEPGVYRMVAAGLAPGGCGLRKKGGEGSLLFYNGLGTTSSFVVSPSGDVKKDEIVRGGAGEGGRVGVARAIVFAHSAFSGASDAQVVEAVKEALDVYGEAWLVVVLIDATVSLGSRALIQATGAHVIDADRWIPATAGNMRWVFFPFLFAEHGANSEIGGKRCRIEHFVVRAAGYSVLARDRAAVDEWIRSGKMLHVVRDSRGHASRGALPHLWGCRAPCQVPLDDTGRVMGLDKLVNLFISAHKAHVRTDEWFMATTMYPLFASRDLVIAHDSVSCQLWEGSLPFPTRRNGTEFVGQVFVCDWGQGGGERESERKRDCVRVLSCAFVCVCV
jgi:hypothetical protein